ncbi:protein-S-isoprenylcysteine carboxyl O-methyltransferase [Aspergillus saccharolyticus JOP 1030-1]|uniref:Protein-S-isoprenylcysteine O-methyltransferase n=1 Tax=Aspergillus saccharolyticus JOP 1030-1 TaxID=1450539 RepID=A0A318ZFJ0_9EURO|nr:ICMT-domain-containing protein [Aspergillus saccharolyticus JOP 1030-1]PYH45845.1 ICMT-domain-containing protein [Aspergillus saccharolyticus JOP 1030-1]
MTTTPPSDSAPSAPLASPTPQYRAYQPTASRTSSHSSSTSTPSPSPSSSPTLDPSNLPNGPKSLSGISLRAFLLGTTLGLTISSTLYLLLTTTSPLWRLPFFLASLSLFHFLEYYTTAAHNPRFATVSAFLLTSNGWAYNVAHGSALLECLLTSTLFPATDHQHHQHRIGSNLYTRLTGGPYHHPHLLPERLNLAVCIGLALMILGQTVRSVAMAQAGSSFNHTVQVARRDDHRLVTTGVYRWLRHPSYFGFFWWGIGTQLVLGNVACLIGYALVLWRFFKLRVRREENYLCAFFGDEYRAYRKRSWVGIPFV